RVSSPRSPVPPCSRSRPATPAASPRPPPGAAVARTTRAGTPPRTAAPTRRRTPPPTPPRTRRRRPRAGSSTRATAPPAWSAERPGARGRRSGYVVPVIAPAVLVLTVSGERPGYLAEVLASWRAARGVDAWPVTVLLEPGT